MPWCKIFILNKKIGNVSNPNGDGQFWFLTTMVTDDGQFSYKFFIANDWKFGEREIVVKKRV